MTSPWIDIEPGNRPDDDETVLVKNDRFMASPTLAYYDAHYDVFFPLACCIHIPITITHFMHIPK